ncbi:Cerato-ulmin hydrophobin family [Daldinia sp. FL1419]|nr:Cerato-ulmin hydrophobin family [Daldinia sp. FL1419]
MQLSTLFVTFLATAVFANPTGYPTGGDGASPYDPCSGLYDTAQCCATDVLGVADLDCHSPKSVPISAKDFRSVCADAGQRARCCVLPILGQAVLCQAPVGV